MIAQHFNTSLFIVHVQEMDDWKKEPIKQVTDHLLRQGITLLISGIDVLNKVIVQYEIGKGAIERPIVLTEPDEDGSQMWMMPKE